jgi:SMODS domain-containing protein
MTIKNRFDRFTKSIRPTDQHIEEANRQTDWMVERLHDEVSDDGTFTLEKVLKAGSNAKFTSLRKTQENRFDVDLGAYFSGQGSTKEQLDKLLAFTRDRLVEIYPNKSTEDFTVLKSAVRVEFKGGIKLWVDVAPIVRDDSLGIVNGGHIPREDGWRLTSVTAHNAFVAKRTADSKSVAGPVRFNRLVRLFKWWNNRQGELVQPSIFCELVAAAAVRETGVTGEWQSSFRQLFLFMRRHLFRQPIVFSDTYDPKAVTIPTGTAVVLDSVNPENNVTYTWTTRTRDDFLNRVQQAYDAMMDARSAEQDGAENEAVDHWCRVFGDAFRTLSEQE